MSDEIHVGDIGTRIELTVLKDNLPLNLSTATDIDLVIGRPTAAKLTVTPTFVTDGTDGKVYYLTVINDLSEAGIYQLQIIATFSGGKWHSEIVKMRVYANVLGV